jgi:hypothetical protein
MLPWLRDEQQELEQAAREARWLTPEQRVELFASIMRMIGLIWESLPFEEQWRRLRIAEQLDGASDAVVVRPAAHGVVVMGVGDVPAVVERIAEVLARLGVQHAFGGAIAQNYWGGVRATQAVDALALIPALRLQEVVDALTAAGFRRRDSEGREGMPAVAEVRAQQARAGLFAVWLGLVKVELFSPVLPLQHRMLERARRMPWRGRMLPVTTPEDLILVKLVFHRDKDMRDIRAMIAITGTGLDRSYLLSQGDASLDVARRDELRSLLGSPA